MTGVTENVDRPAPAGESGSIPAARMPSPTPVCGRRKSPGTDNQGPTVTFPGRLKLRHDIGDRNDSGSRNHTGNTN